MGKRPSEKLVRIPIKSDDTVDAFLRTPPPNKSQIEKLLELVAKKKAASYDADAPSKKKPKKK